MEHFQQIGKQIKKLRYILEHWYLPILRYWKTTCHKISVAI